MDALTDDAPRLVWTDAVGVPVGQFQKTGPVRYTPPPAKALEVQGHIDTAVMETGQFVVTGWGTWTGPLSEHELDVTLSGMSNATPTSAPTRALLIRMDLPVLTQRESTALNGFTLRIPVETGTSKPAICLVARDLSTGRRTLLHNPPDLAYCPLAD